MINQRQIKNFAYNTLAEIKAVVNGGAVDKLLSYCVETKTWYRYLTAGSVYTANDTTVLITSEGGNTRWIGIAGLYIYETQANTLQTLTLISRIDEIGVRNATGAQIDAFKVVKVNGDYPTDSIPLVTVISGLTDMPIGVIMTNLATATTGVALKRGRLLCTGFDTQGAAIGDKVYCTAAGAISLTPSILEIGYVLSLAANGVVYFNIGGGGASIALPLSIANGGTSLSAIAVGSILAANTTDTLAPVTSASGYKMLINNAASISWSDYQLNRYVANYADVTAYSDVAFAALIGAPFAPDGTNVINDNLILFTENTTTANRGVYKATVIGGNLTALTRIPSGQNPTGVGTLGDTVYVAQGTLYANILFRCTVTATATWAINKASASNNGFLSSTDWSTFNGKQSALTTNALQELTSAILTISDVTVIGATPRITVAQATTGTSGYLSSTDWNTFNGKQAALTFGIADTNKVQINSADVADNDFAKFTATGLEGRSFAEVLTDLSLPNSLITGTNKRLGVKDIDGIINTIDTNYALYTVGGGTYAKSVKIYICNRNSGYTAKVRLAHIDGAIGDIAVEDYILFDDYLLPYETKVIEIEGMITAATLLCRSNVSLVNFEACGQETTVDTYHKRVGALDIDGATNLINTDKVVYTSDRATKANCIICNRNSGYVAEVQIAHVNSNDIANIADEDRKFFTLDVNQSLFLELDLNMATAEIISLRSDTTNVNMLVYLSE